MKFKHIATLISTLSVVSVSTAGLDTFQQKINQIAQENGAAAPDVKKELSGTANSNAEQPKQKQASPAVSPIDRVVAIDADVIRAIQAK